MHNLDVSLKEATFLSLDLESTGTDTSEDRIIEIGVCTFREGEVVDRYQQLVDPGRPLPPVITEVTGIRPEELVGMPTFDLIAPALVERLQEAPLLAYNHEFDISLLRAELQRHGLPTELPPCLDPFPFCWEYFRTPGKTKNAKLGTICEFLNIPLDAAHRADHDAEAAGRVMLALHDHADLPPDLKSLLSIQRALLQKVNEAFARFRRGRGEGRSVLNDQDIVIELGAAWLYGDEPDPLRALFRRIPDIRDL